MNVSLAFPPRKLSDIGLSACGRFSIGLPGHGTIRPRRPERCILVQLCSFVARTFACPTLRTTLLIGVLATGYAQEIGKPLPAWTAGTLDIHQISTGRGNAALFVLPDGTTLLVDAGAAGNGLPETEPHPDASRS